MATQQSARTIGPISELPESEEIRWDSSDATMIEFSESNIPQSPEVLAPDDSVDSVVTYEQIGRHAPCVSSTLTLDAFVGNIKNRWNSAMQKIESSSNGKRGKHQARPSGIDKSAFKGLKAKWERGFK